MERLNKLLIEALSEDFNCSVVAPPGAAAHLPSAVTTIECKSDKPLWFLLEAGWRAAGTVLFGESPAITLATSGLTAPLALLSSRLANADFAVCVHGLDIVAASRTYQAFFVPCLKRASLIVANSRNTARLAREVGVEAEKIEVVHPGVEALPLGEPDPTFKQDFELGEGPILLSVGRLVKRKGIIPFVQHSLPPLIEEHPDLRLVIVGNQAGQAVRREKSILTMLEEAVEGAGLSKHVRLLGALNDVDLNRAYSIADIHVFPVIPVHGDVEGFGMVAAEAAAHGIPTLGFAEGGVCDAVVNGVTGFLVENQDYQALTLKILQQLADPMSAEQVDACRAAARTFSAAEYQSRILNLVGKFLG